MAGKDKKPPNSYFSVACGLRGQIIALLSLLIVLPFCTPAISVFATRGSENLASIHQPKLIFLEFFTRWLKVTQVI